MVNPGAGISGVKRIAEERAGASLCSPLSPRVIKQSYRYEQWVSWDRVRHIAFFVKTNGVRTAGEWRRLARICQTVSRPKRAFLYREFRAMFSPASLKFLFGDFHPMPWELRT